MSDRKHQNYLRVMTQRALLMPDLPEDGDAILPLAEKFVPFAAWMLMSLRAEPDLQSITLHSRLHVETQQWASGQPLLGVDLRTEIDLVFEGAQVFTSDADKAQFILDFLPGTWMSHGAFVLDRSAPELEILDALGPRDALDIECTVYRLAKRLTYEISRVRIRRSFGLRPSGRASGPLMAPIDAAACAQHA